jgi:phosphate:Na+ symporter
LDKCLQKFSNAEERNVNILREAMSLASKEHVNEIRVVSLLNTNRSVYMALQSLMAASKVVNLHFPLEDEAV